MLSVSKSLKSMYSRLVILVRIFSGSGGNVLKCGGCGAGWWFGCPRNLEEPLGGDWALVEDAISRHLGILPTWRLSCLEGRSAR